MRFLLFSLVILLSQSNCFAKCEGECEDNATSTIAAKQVNYLKKITVKFPMNLVIKQGRKNEYYITGNEESVKELKVKMQGGELIFEKKTLHMGPAHIDNITAYITVKNLLSIHSEGRVAVDFQNLKGNKLLMECQGRTIVNGSLSLNEFSCSFSGYTELQLKGSVDSQEIEMTGLGSYDASQLTSHEIHLNMQGNIQAMLNVDQKLYATLSGSSSAVYSGSPKIIESNLSGSSTLRRSN